MFPEGAPANLETLDAFPHEVVDEPTLWVPLSDGTRLAARLWQRRLAPGAILSL